MEVTYLPLALEHREFWKKSGNKQVQKKISDLINDILKHPYEGIGKPHGLKHQLSGSWARSITDEHRLVYEVMLDGTIEIQRMKGHY